MSFLATIGKDFKGVFAWLGSTSGQKTVNAIEGVGETVATALGDGAIVQVGINILNKWLGEAIKVETLSAAAGQQTGSGATKAAAVLSVMTPELTSYLQSQGVTSANIASQANAINAAVVNLLNTFVSPNVAPVGGPVPPAPGTPVA